MNYSIFEPNSKLDEFVECYWSVVGTEREWQKITPDGCTEMVFHYGDPYFLKSPQTEQVQQPKAILAGQIDQPIFLKASGQSDILGIKFTTTGIWKMFGIDMKPFTNYTVSLFEVVPQLRLVWNESLKYSDTESRIAVIEKCLLSQLDSSRTSRLDPIIEKIKNEFGNISIKQLCEDFHIVPRQLERAFNEQVGVSAKMFARVIRFANVYKLLQKPDLSKSDATYIMGFFDQAHFNKEFKQFTGESPERYFEGNHYFSNFFLDR